MYHPALFLLTLVKASIIGSDSLRRVEKPCCSHVTTVNNLAEILEVDHIDVFHVAFADLAQVRLRYLNAASVAVTWLQSHGPRSRWATSMTLLTRLCEKSLTKLSARS